MFPSKPTAYYYISWRVSIYSIYKKGAEDWLGNAPTRAASVTSRPRARWRETPGRHRIPFVKGNVRIRGQCPSISTRTSARSPACHRSVGQCSRPRLRLRWNDRSLITVNCDLSVVTTSRNVTLWFAIIILRVRNIKQCRDTMYTFLCKRPVVKCATRKLL